MKTNKPDATEFDEIDEAWTPYQVASFYNLPIENLTGKGQHIAIMGLGQPPEEDILKDVITTATDGKYKGTFTVLELPGDKTKNYRQPFTSTGEYGLDAQVVACLCPEADITLIVGVDSFRGAANVIDKAVELGCKVLTSSYDWLEDSVGQGPSTSASGLKAIKKAMKKAGKNGLTIFVASGDYGSGVRIGHHAVADDDRSVHLGVLSTQRFVVSCGGTEIRSEDRAPVETAWNESNLNLDDANAPAGAGTGGVSKLQRLPGWQKAHKRITNANTGNTGRIVPDVSAVGSFVDWNVAIDTEADGKWVMTTSPHGGTSAVAPFYAAIIALVNEQRAALNPPKGPVGFINKWLYKKARKQNLFNDIVQGDNRPKARCDQGSDPPKNATLTFSLLDAPYPGYDASRGFDACTGWGTPNGSVFFDALVAMD